MPSEVEARVVKLDWTGSGVTFYVSTDGSSWSALQKDQPFILGTPGRSLYLKAVLAADASSVLDRYLLQINPNGFNLFTGKMLTEATGLVYFGARWYDPELGRFITVDPAEDGENWYQYCRNNPLNVTDQDGMWAGGDDLAAFVGGGLVSAGIEFGYQAWTGNIDGTKIFTAFLKGGLSGWMGLYTGAGGISVYAFLDATEETARAKLQGQNYSFGQFCNTFSNDMISGVLGGALGKGIAKFAGRLAPHISEITSKFKLKFGTLGVGNRKIPFRKLLTKSELEEFKVLKAKYPDWMPDEKDLAKVLTPDELKGVRPLVKQPGHHKHPLVFGGEPNPSNGLVKTGDTRKYKNPIHVEITNFWNKILRRIRNELEI